MPRNWTHRMVIAIPVDKLAIAEAIGRAADFDVGGECSFDHVRALAGPGAEFGVSDALTAQDAVAAYTTFSTSSSLLFQMCAADYAARWSGLTPPSLADCQAFQAGVLVRIEPRGRALSEVMVDIGLEITHEPS